MVQCIYRGNQVTGVWQARGWHPRNMPARAGGAGCTVCPSCLVLRGLEKVACADGSVDRQPRAWMEQGQVCATFPGQLSISVEVHRREEGRESTENLVSNAGKGFGGFCSAWLCLEMASP